VTSPARTRRRVAARLCTAVALPLLLGLPACSIPEGPLLPASEQPTPTASVDAATPAPTGPSEITLAFAGDVHFTDRTLKLLKSPATAFGPVAKVLSSADLAMVNLETAITNRGKAEPKQFHFRAPESAWLALGAAGVDVVTSANNHALDYGQVGLADTLNSAAEAGMPLIGAGKDVKAAYAPWITEVKGVRIAFLAMSQVSELASSWAASDNKPGIAMAFDLERSVAAVKSARNKADVVVVYVHWGTEGQECPNGQQRSFAAAIAKAGASVIVGTHAHLLEGDGWIGDTYVQYGMGNFVWWLDEAFSNDTGVIRVTLHGDQIFKTELVPAVISAKTGQPIPVSGKEAARVQKKFTALHTCTGLADAPAGRP
jgi:poly-gamma-glutamate synthesis protein (capsule biosynthesis protein)